MRLAFGNGSSLFEESAQVVAATNLLAAVANAQFAIDKLHANQQSWARPSALSLGSWLTSFWRAARYASPDIGTLLSPAQEHRLWKTILEGQSGDLFDFDATARMAARSARLLADWQISLDTENWPDRGDAGHFRHWYKLFRNRCQSEGWLTAGDLWRHVPHWFSRGVCEPSATTFLLLRPPVPALANLLSALEQQVSVRRLSPTGRSGPVRGTRFEDPADELESAARWARASYEANGNHSMGIFVPNLASRRSEVERAFRDVFYTGSCRSLVDNRLEHKSASDLVYSFAEGGSLRSEPLVAGTLLLLHLASHRLPTSEAGAILRSRWVGGASAERSRRAMADLELRRRRQLDVSLSDLELASAACSRFTELLGGVRLLLQSTQERQTFGKWSEFVGTLLATLGWPGEDDLTLAEASAVEGWKNALSQLSSLSLVSGPVDFATARKELTRLLDAPLPGSFAPWQPVHILDSAHVSGLWFDRAVALVLNDDTWPPPRAGEPFVPLELQRKHHVHGSSRPSQREDKEQLTRSLFAAAGEIHATWSGRLSALAGPYIKAVGAPLDGWTGKTTWPSYRPAILEDLVDTQGPGYNHAQSARGGTGIIKSQSLCPFRAFAEYRLGSNTPEEGCLGFDNRDRGGHLHTVLEIVWKKLQSSERLRATSTLALTQIVDAAASEAVGAVADASPFGEVVGLVERERLREVVLDWLNTVERERQEPFTVETVEGEQFVHLAGLKLRLRLDRIDRLRNGGLLLIDYKSGEQKRKKLELPRPEEPQLLVYASCMAEKVEGVIFAQLKARDVRPVGFTRGKHFKSRTVDAEGSRWYDRLADSKVEVETLARQFEEGYAPVDPRMGACAYCGQKPLCRINERLGGAETEEE